MKRLVLVLGALSIISAACALSGWVNASPNVVSVDMTHIKGQFIAQLARHAASPQMVTTANTRFNRMLHLVLEKYATRAHVVILDRQYVLGVLSKAPTNVPSGQNLSNHLFC
jgi:hypothetical protein